MIKYLLICAFIFNASFYSFSQQTGSFKDLRDEKVYKTVKVGNQKWMAENLNTAFFRNGDSIPEIKSNEEWEKADEEGKPGWCYYDNNQDNGKLYGKLYNRYAVTDPRGLAPEGWRVPDYKDWLFLAVQFGGPQKAGTHMRSKSGWGNNEGPFDVNDDNNGSNKSGFTGLPGGGRSSAGAFVGKGDTAYWISNDNMKAKSFQLMSGRKELFAIRENSGGSYVRFISNVK
jgi:uncharacterized protein (TIGR02145 family)